MSGCSNESARLRMKKILSKAINGELTERQKNCIIEYYINGTKMIDIAKKEGISESTVSRHIKSGKKRLQRIAQYYI